MLQPVSQSIFQYLLKIKRVKYFWIEIKGCGISDYLKRSAVVAFVEFRIQKIIDSRRLYF